MITVQLATPIPVFGKSITQISWRVNYPDNQLYYQLQTAGGVVFSDGNWSVPAEIVNAWGADDSVISNAVIEEKPWEK